MNEGNPQDLVIQNDQLLAEALENTIRCHGVLLEHEVQQQMRKILSRLYHSLRACERSYALKGLKPTGEEDCVDVDVFVESTKIITELDEIFRGDVAQQGLLDAHVASIYLMQCKGHDEDGFLLCNLTKPPEDFRTPVFTRSADAPRDVFDSRTIDRLYKDPTRSFVVEFVDWAYFYTGELVDWANGKQQVKINMKRPSKFIPAFKQDRGAQGNKFLSALEQINDTIEMFFSQRRIFNPNDRIQRVLPVIVTNAPIFGMRCSDGRVHLLKDFPWVVFRNGQAKIGRRWSSWGMYDYVYIVDVRHLEHFCKSMDQYFESAADVAYDSGVIEVGEFPIAKGC